MPEPVWFPHLTVAAIIEQEGRYLCVEEHPRHSHVINQPAGHVEQDETLVTAIRREVMEETGHHFRPKAIVGLYYFLGTNGVSYMRICFCGKSDGQEHGGPLDPEITRTHWLTLEQLRQQNLRSPIVLDCIKDYLAGRRFPLDLLQEPPYNRHS